MELRPSPVVVFEFDGVRVLNWSEDEEVYEELSRSGEAADVVGQVGSFDWDGSDRLDLQTLLLSIQFRASRLTVSTEDSDHD